MDPCKHEFTIEPLDLRHKFYFAVRRLNARGYDRAGTERVVEYDLDVRSRPHIHHSSMTAGLRIGYASRPDASLP